MANEPFGHRLPSPPHFSPSMWHRIASYIIRFRIFLLVSLLAITAIAGYIGSNVQLSYEFTNAIPKDNPKYQEYQNFRQQFGEDGNVMVVGLQTERFFEDAFFRDYVALVHHLEQIRGVAQVLAVPTAVNLVKDTMSGKLKTARIVSDQKIEAGEARKVFTNLPFYKGLLYNPKSAVYIMAIRIDRGVLNSPMRNGVVRAIQAACQQFASKHQETFHYSGLPLIRTMMATQVQSEMKMFLVLSFLLTAFILTLFFRSASAVLASMAVVATGVVWSLATIVIMGYKITLLTALIPPLIVVIGIPNCVYLLNKYHSEYNQHGNKIKALIRSVDRMGIVTLFTNLTAAIGFGVFFFTKSAILKEFGLVAGINIMGIFVISLILIPAFFSLLPPPHRKHTSYLESKWMLRLLDLLTKWALHHRPAIYVVTVVACLLSVFGILRLRSVGYIVDDLPREDVVYQDLKFFERHFRGVMPLEIVVNSQKRNGAITLPMLEKLDALGKRIQQFPEIGHVLSIAEGVKFARQAYYNGDSSSFSVPNVFDGAFIQPYLRADKNKAKSTTLNSLVQSFIDSNKQETRVSVQLADVGSVRLPQLLDSIRPIAFEIFDTSRYHVRFTGTSVVFLEGSKFIINSLRDSLILSFLMIFGCMIFLFRSWKILVVSIAINMAPLLVTAGIMGWAGIPLKPSTVLVFSVALGITIDVTIRFLVSYRQELKRHQESIETTVKRTIHDTGLSIVYTSLILIVGFGVFAASAFDGTKSLGYLTSLTLMLAMICNLTLQPALLLWLEKARQGHTHSE